jgi:Zn finger protein HypA/HybF involved in hydrogenase expression
MINNQEKERQKYQKCQKCGSPFVSEISHDPVDGNRVVNICPKCDRKQPTIPQDTYSGI